MELIMLGTGEAMVTECYNTCFILREKDACFLVDGGGGNGLLGQIKNAGIDWTTIRTIFVTHKHIDHIMGIVWMIRRICQAMGQGQYEGEAVIYAHDEVIDLLRNMAKTLLDEKQSRFVDERLHLIAVTDGAHACILKKDVTFFDVHSINTKQFGFCVEWDDKKLTCCGDEPYHPSEKRYVQHSTWLLHEAFCLYAQAERFKPYEKHHSTVKDACELAQRMQVENLLLYHMEDENISCRKRLYLEEGKKYYHGNLYVPDDLEKISL